MGGGGGERGGGLRFVPICVPCFREYPDLLRFLLPALPQKVVGDFFLFWEATLAGSVAGLLQDFFGPTRLGTPPTSYRSQKRPRLEKSKKSLRGSLRGVPADAPKRVRNESPGDSVSQRSPDF